MLVKFGKVRGSNKVNSFLKSLPRGTVRPALIAFVEYIIGDGKRGLSHDDPYKKTTRKAVYGQTFESEAQRKYVMAAIRDGTIQIGQRKPNPTESSKQYGYKITNNGYNATITNSSEGAYWARKWGGWRNWRNFDKVVADNMKGAVRAATQAVNRWIKANAKKS